MDPTIIYIIAAVAVVLVIVNQLQTKKQKKKAEIIGAQIYDQIMAGPRRSSDMLPVPEVLGCAVAAYAANSGVLSTFTSKGEPLAKYKLRQLMYEALPAQYRKERVYFNCANMEALIFWIVYMQKFFIKAISVIYQANDEWTRKFHEYYWKLSIYNMVINMRKPDVPIFFDKLEHASSFNTELDYFTLGTFLSWGTELPDEIAENTALVFSNQNTLDFYARVDHLINSRLASIFKTEIELQGKNLVSLFVPENGNEAFELDDDDRKLAEIVDKQWEEIPIDIKIPKF